MESDEETERPVLTKFPTNQKKTSRAKSLEELQQRLQAITTKKKLSYKEKLVKKGLKNRMKRKSARDERNATKKIQRAAKLSEKKDEDNDAKDIKLDINTNKSSQPVFNKEDKMVYSKIDFANLGKVKKVKKEKDPKVLLKKIEQEKEKIEKFKESGEVQKATEMKEKTAWTNALAKAAGEKVKDDPILLKKSLRKQQQKQRSSKNKWEQRQKGVEKTMDDRQKKRQENIQKRKKDKKTKKLKNAAKKGKIIPGF